MNRKQHWETVYKTKTPDQVSWTQATPTTSLDFIHSFPLDKNARIIDVGGGDSKLVDFLLDEGFEHITVLDISATAIEKAKKRLGAKANKVTWIVSDIVHFTPTQTYDVWHDRAAFHFLTTSDEIKTYFNIVKKCVTHYLIIGTFSENGPKKCSGLDIQQYNEQQLTAVFREPFQSLKCINKNHKTPFDTVQHFLFCSFQKQHQ